MDRNRSAVERTPAGQRPHPELGTRPTPNRDAAGLYADYSSLLHNAAIEPLAEPGDSDDNETVKADTNQLTSDDADRAEADDNGDGADPEPPGAQAS